jgi:hypothetical protein
MAHAMVGMLRGLLSDMRAGCRGGDAAAAVGECCSTFTWKGI